MMGAIGAGTPEGHSDLVMEEAKLLQAPEVEVDKGNSSQRPGDGDGAHSGLRTRYEADDVGGKDEEEQRSQEGTCFLKPSPITSAPTPSEMKL